MSLIKPEIILGISRRVGSILGKTPDDLDNLYIATRLSNVELGKFKHHPIEQIIEHLSETIANDMSIRTSSLETTIEDIDINQWQKETVAAGYDEDQFDIDTTFAHKEVGFQSDAFDEELTTIVARELSVQRMFNLNDLHTIQRLVAPKTQHRSVFVLLDTDNADPALSEGNKFGWSFIDSPLLKEGTINGIGGTGNLVGMHIYPITTTLTAQPQALYAASAFPLAVVNAGQSPFYFNDFLNTNNTFTILIEEFSAHSYVGREGRKFHFSQFPFLLNAFTQINSGSWPSPTPYYEFISTSKGDGWFWFNKPITEFSTITVSLANPFTEISLSKTVRTIIPIELIFLADSDE